MNSRKSMQQTRPQGSHAKSKSRRRAFFGNLRHCQDLEEKLRILLRNSAIIAKEIEIVVCHNKRGNKNVGDTQTGTCFAFVDCDVDLAVKCLDGLQFNGRILNVTPEKKKRVERNDGSFNIKKFGGSGWSKPPQQPKINHVESTRVELNHNKISNENDPLPSFSDNVAELVSCEMKDAAENDISPLDTAIASTVAVMTVLSAHVNDELPDNKKDVTTNTVVNTHITAESKQDINEISLFHTKCNQSLSNLLEEYGDYNPNLEVVVPEIMNSTSKDSLCLNRNNNNTNDDTGKNSSMLAPRGKTPIHIQLVSFGYKYGSPAKGTSGWNHSDPLPFMDCRDLPRAPHHVAKLSGLSFRVKRALMNQNEDNDENANQNDENEMTAGKRENSIKVRSEDIAKKVFSSLEEAISGGEYGWGNPLDVTVHIGSEYGRHRSVVLCEIVAQSIRKLLRKNSSGSITIPVSIDSRHRDVDQNHKDDEAFGSDLRRQHELEVKLKRNQKRRENR